MNNNNDTNNTPTDHENQYIEIEKYIDDLISNKAVLIKLPNCLNEFIADIDELAKEKPAVEDYGECCGGGCDCCASDKYDKSVKEFKDKKALLVGRICNKNCN